MNWNQPPQVTRQQRLTSIGHVIQQTNPNNHFNQTHRRGKFESGMIQNINPQEPQPSLMGNIARGINHFISPSAYGSSRSNSDIRQTAQAQLNHFQQQQAMKKAKDQDTLSRAKTTVNSLFHQMNQQAQDYQNKFQQLLNAQAQEQAKHQKEIETYKQWVNKHTSSDITPRQLPLLKPVLGALNPVVALEHYMFGQGRPLTVQMKDIQIEHLKYHPKIKQINKIAFVMSKQKMTELKLNPIGISLPVSNLLDKASLNFVTIFIDGTISLTSPQQWIFKGIMKSLDGDKNTILIFLLIVKSLVSSQHG